MLIKEIVIIHKSLIIRKGLSSLLEEYGRPATAVFSGFSEPEAGLMRKSVIFADTGLMKEMESFILRSDVTRNIFAGIGEPVRNKNTDGFFRTYIDTNDSREKLFSKLDIVFPSGSVYSTGRESALTLREKEILKLVAKGLRSREIASQLFISRHTVITHRKNICGKLGIKTPSGLTLYALVNKLL